MYRKVACNIFVFANPSLLCNDSGPCDDSRPCDDSQHYGTAVGATIPDAGRHMYFDLFKQERILAVAIEERDKSTRNPRLYLACGVIKLVMNDEQFVEDVRRERHAEKLRRAYEALGREQNGIFESLAEYTHEVQAEVRALEIARDRLYVEQLPSSSPPVPLRVGRPLVLGDRWLSFDTAAAGIMVCGVLGVVLGWCWYQGTSFWAGLRNKDKTRRNLHEE